MLSFVTNQSLWHGITQTEAGLLTIRKVLNWFLKEGRVFAVSHALTRLLKTQGKLQSVNTAVSFTNRELTSTDWLILNELCAAKPFPNNICRVGK